MMFENAYVLDIRSIFVLVIELKPPSQWIFAILLREAT